MPHMWHQNVPRKQTPLKCLGQNIFIQVTMTEFCVLTTTCFTKTHEYRAAHFTEWQARACRGEGFAAQMEPEENWEAAPVPCVLSHSCSNAITNALPSSPDQKDEWQDNYVRHWENAYSPNTLSELCTECKRRHNPRWNPENEWHWQLDLMCTSVRLKLLRNTLNQCIELTSERAHSLYRLHDLTLHAAAQTGAQPELSKAFAAKVLHKRNSSWGRAGPHQGQD